MKVVVNISYGFYPLYTFIGDHLLQHDFVIALMGGWGAFKRNTLYFQEEYDQLLVLLGRQPDINLQPDKLSAVEFGT